MLDRFRILPECTHLRKHAKWLYNLATLDRTTQDYITLLIHVGTSLRPSLSPQVSGVKYNIIYYVKKIPLPHNPLAQQYTPPITSQKPGKQSAPTQ